MALTPSPANQDQSLKGALIMTMANNTTALKVPHFKINEVSGRYMARHSLTDLQIVKAAKAILANKVDHVDVLSDVDVVSDYLIAHFSERKSEAFIVLFCDTKNRLMACETLFTGTIDGAAVYPREVVRRSLELNAASVIFAHNHPSGSSQPSQADRMITRRLKDALETVDIRTLDHFIIGGGEAYSFSRHSLL